MRTGWKDQEVFNFCMNMAMVLESGLSLEEGIDVVKESCDKSMRADLIQLQDKVMKYGSLTLSLRDEKFLDDYAKKMIEIGEMSGTLDHVMKELAQYYERSHDLKQNLKEALLYPFLLLLMMWVIVFLIVWKVLPIFSSVLHRMGTILPGSATSMMSFGQMFGYVSLFVLSILILFGIYLFVQNRSARGNALTFVPFTKKLFYQITMAKLTYAFSLFISSGYDVEEALTYVVDVVDHTRTKSKIQECQKALSNGENFVDVMKDVHLYEGLYANMIYTGFRSGKSEDVLKKASSLYEKDVDASISAFLNIIEPCVVVLLSIIVGVILLSVMLPLMSIMASI